MQLAEPLLPDHNIELAVSIVMPCLNEIQSLPHCIANAWEALAAIEARYGLGGEVVVADNGSTDGSQMLATQLGARVIDVSAKGYGAALIGGFGGAYGRYLVMGDADGSYNFIDAVAMIGRLLEGADLCMGSRFKGGIGPGAMPWKNRYIGNPALTAILNLFFRTGVDDAHCGLRAVRREAYARLNLQSSGMEFASEMIIKASLHGLRIDEVPATLSPDLRERAPHLRPWRDGWRHLRYLFMLSPTWAFVVPAAGIALTGLLVLALVVARTFGLVGPMPFGESWSVVGAMLVACGHLGLIMALSAHLDSARSGYRQPAKWLFALRPMLKFESFLVVGFVLAFIAVLGLGLIAQSWSARDFQPLATVLPVVLTGLAGTLGMQTIFGGFLLAVLSGHNADFLRGFDEPDRQQKSNFSTSLLRPIPAYTLAAAICALLHNAIMISLDALRLHYFYCQIVSALVLLPIGYLLISRAVYGSALSGTGFGRYLLAMLSNFPVQFVLIWFLRGKLDLPMAVTAPVATVVLYLWNYLFSYWALARKVARHA